MCRDAWQTVAKPQVKKYRSDVTNRAAQQSQSIQINRMFKRETQRPHSRGNVCGRDLDQMRGLTCMFLYMCVYTHSLATPKPHLSSCLPLQGAAHGEERPREGQRRLGLSSGCLGGTGPVLEGCARSNFMGSSRFYEDSWSPIGFHKLS